MWKDVACFVSTAAWRTFYLVLFIHGLYLFFKGAACRKENASPEGLRPAEESD